jgi:PadR family transcriptional regulator
MPSPRFPIPQGTLDMLILQILSLEPAHGYGIAQRLEQISRSVVQVNQGSLYCSAPDRLDSTEGVSWSH